MRVLLVSPLRGLDPQNGDVTYTETLLRTPPSGIEYVTYAAALASGELIENFTRKSFRQTPVRTLINAVINVLRRFEFLFSEPYRYFSVKPRCFDLIHCHVFHTCWNEADCPLVLTAGSPQSDPYKDGRRLPKNRVRWYELCESILAWAFATESCSYRISRAEQVGVYSKYFRDYMLRKKVCSASRIEILPICAERRTVRPVRRQPKRIGFIARDFVVKGGAILLEAFRKIRETRQDLELVIVGSTPMLSAEDARTLGITWLPAIPREELLEHILPSLDVVAYPTRYDCISYALLEAMSFGIAIAASDYNSIPEVLANGDAGLLSPVDDPKMLALNIEQLLDPDTNARFRDAALHYFDNHYSIDIVIPKLGALYTKAAASWKAKDQCQS